jgi:hypothetical protein
MCLDHVIAGTNAKSASSRVASALVPRRMSLGRVNTDPVGSITGRYVCKRRLRSREALQRRRSVPCRWASCARSDFLPYVAIDPKFEPLRDDARCGPSYDH